MFQIIKLVVLFGFAIWLFFAYTQPVWEEVGEIKADVEEHSDALVKVSGFNQNIVNLIARKDNLNQAQLDRMNVMVPLEIDETGVMADVQAIVERNRARLLTVGVSEWTGGVGEKNDDEKVVGLQELEHSTKDINITVEGTYQQIKQILSDLESSLVLLEVIDVSFAAVEGDIVAYSLVIRINRVK